MAEVKWPARRISDGVLVDVTADTDGGPFGAPVPNPIEGGAGAAGVTVDNQSDPPAEVTTLIAPGWSVAGDEATVHAELPIEAVATGATDAEVAINATAEEGDANITLEAFTETGGTSSVTLSAGTNIADASLVVQAEPQAGVIVTAADGIHFNGGGPVRPVVPLTAPDTQDVIDALVALGLVTQSD